MKCSICGKTVTKKESTVVEGSVFCNDCIGLFEGFDFNKEYTNTVDLEMDQLKINNIIKNNQLSSDVADSFILYFAHQKEKIIEEEKIRQFIVTTGSNLEGYRIVRYTGIVTDTKKTKDTDSIESVKESLLRSIILQSMKNKGNAIIGLSYSIIPMNDEIIIQITGTSVFIDTDLSGKISFL